MWRIDGSGLDNSSDIEQLMDSHAPVPLASQSTISGLVYEDIIVVSCDEGLEYGYERSVMWICDASGQFSPALLEPATCNR